MDLETIFMGFIVAFKVKINDFGSNIGTLYHLTTSSTQQWVMLFRQLLQAKCTNNILEILCVNFRFATIQAQSFGHICNAYFCQPENKFDVSNKT